MPPRRSGPDVWSDLRSDAAVARRRAVAKDMMGGKCPLWVGKLDPQG